MKLKHAALALATPLLMNAQEVMTPEILWQLRKISVQGVSPDYSSVLYRNKSNQFRNRKKQTRKLSSKYKLFPISTF